MGTHVVAVAAARPSRPAAASCPCSSSSSCSACSTSRSSARSATGSARPRRRRTRWCPASGSAPPPALRDGRLRRRPGHRGGDRAGRADHHAPPGRHGGSPRGRPEAAARPRADEDTRSGRDSGDESTTNRATVPSSGGRSLITRKDWRLTWLHQVKTSRPGRLLAALAVLIIVMLISILRRRHHSPGELARATSRSASAWTCPAAPPSRSRRCRPRGTRRRARAR